MLATERKRRTLKFEVNIVPCAPNPEQTKQPPQNCSKSLLATVTVSVILVSRFPSNDVFLVEKIYFGGEHDNGYAPTLAAIENEGYLNKIVLLQGYSPLAEGIKPFNLAMLESHSLFLDDPLPDNTKGYTSAKSSPRPPQPQLPSIQQEIKNASEPTPPINTETPKVCWL